jgi:hypothetical protein
MVSCDLAPDGKTYLGSCTDYTSISLAVIIFIISAIILFYLKNKYGKKIKIGNTASKTTITTSVMINLIKKLIFFFFDK